MRRKNVLNKNQTINIGGKDFTISGFAGEGSTCVVYYANRQDNVPCVIKELYPEGYEFTRAPETKRITNYGKAEAEFLRFLETVETMKAIYRVDSGYTNYIDSCSGGGYLVMQWLKGEIFEKYVPQNSKDLFEKIKLIAERLKIYHKHNYLYLDIKPENIFCCDDSNRVQIIDFDSVIEGEAQKENVTIRCSSDWAAPELITGKRDQICSATDVYAIGEILYYKLTGEHSDSLERTMHGNHKFEKSKLLKGVNPALLKKLTEFFRKTLCSAPSARYSDEELIEALNELIDLSEAPFIIPNLEKAPSFFVGREKLFDEVHDLLQENHYLFIRGIDGIGKTAFAVKYAYKYSGEYDVIYHTETSDPIDEIQLGNYFNDSLKNQDKDEDTSEKRDDKRTVICNDMSKKNMLIIFDNAENFSEATIEALLDKRLVCDKLFLTRENKPIFKQRNSIKLDAPSETESFEIFKFHLDWIGGVEVNENEQLAVSRILKAKACHPLLVEQAAKSIYDSDWDIIEYAKMTSEEAKRSYEKGDERIMTDEIIKKEFDLAELDKISNDARSIFASLSLLPVQGVRARCLEKKTIVNALIRNGWAQERMFSKKRIISLHNLHRELAEEILYNEPHLCDDFLNGLSESAKTNPRDLDKVTMIIFVAAKLIDVTKLLKTAAVADFLTNAAKMRGARICREACFATAISIYLALGNAEKTLDTAEKWCIFHDRSNTLVEQNFLNCLDEMLKKITPDEKSKLIFDKMFIHVFKRLGYDQDEENLRNWYDKFERLHPGDEGSHVKSLAEKVALEKRHYIPRNDTPNLDWAIPEENIAIANDEESNSEVNPRPLLQSASEAMHCLKEYSNNVFGISPQYKTVRSCLERIKSTLDISGGNNREIFELLDEGIERLKGIDNPEDGNRVVFDMINEILDELSMFDILKTESHNTYR